MNDLKVMDGWKGLWFLVTYVLLLYRLMNQSQSIIRAKSKTISNWDALAALNLLLLYMTYIPI